MRKAVLFLLAFFFSQVLFSQTPNWAWAVKGSGSHDDVPHQVATDKWGNVYMTGWFASDTFQLPPVVLYNSGNSPTRDYYLVKYNSQGVVQWVETATGAANDEGKAVSVDALGNVYVAGQFESVSLAFGSQTVNNSHSGGVYDIFVAKYDSSGTLQWVKGFGNLSHEEVFGIETDAAGNSYVSGASGPFFTNFGSHPFFPAGSHDTYIFRIDASGNVSWVNGLYGRSGYDAPRGSAMNSKGETVIGGLFGSDTLFADNDTLLNKGGYDLFVATFDVAGNVVMAKSYGTIGDEEISSVSTDLAGNIYITGYFREPQMALGSYTLTNVSGYDGFFARLDSAGNVLWAQSIRGNSNVFPKGVSADNYGNVYLTGNYSHNITFGTTTFTAANSFKVHTYLVQYDAESGTVNWAENIDDEFVESPVYVTNDIYGSVYLAGTFGPSVTIGTHTLSGSPDGHTSVFLTKLCMMPQIPSVPGVTVCPGAIAGLSLHLAPGYIANWYNAAANGTLLAAGSSFSTITSQTVFLELLDTVPGCGLPGGLFPVSFSVHPSAGISVTGNTLITNLPNIPGIAYDWYDCDYGGFIHEYSDKPLPPHQNGNYALVITVGDCVDTSDCFNFILNDIHEAAAQRQVRIYSADSRILIESSGGSFVIYDALGRRVGEAELRKGHGQSAVLKPGIYYVTDRATVVRKVLVQ